MISLILTIPDDANYTPPSIHLNVTLSRVLLVLAGLPPASLGAASAMAAATAAAASTAAMSMGLAGIPGEAFRRRCKSRGWLVCDVAGEGTATAQLGPWFCAMYYQCAFLGLGGWGAT